MTAEEPLAGLTRSRALIFDPGVIVPAPPFLQGPLTDMPPLLATACMVGCRGHLHRHPEGLSRGPWGTRLDLSHIALSHTTAWMRVMARVELVAAEARKLRFKP